METKKGTYTYEYPRPSVTTDCVIFGYDVKEGLSVLLVKRGIEPFKDRWAFPGGFLQMDETSDECAMRELQEETGLAIYTAEATDDDYEDEFMLESRTISDAKVVTSRKSAFFEQIGCFSDVERDPRGRVISIAYYALVEKGKVEGGDDARLASWFPIDSVPSLAFDHEKILRAALRRLKERMHFKPIGFDLLPEVFTIPQLQSLYESILEVHFDRRNFGAKMLKLGILDEVGDRPKNAGPRIPVNYRFNKEKYEEMKSKGFRLEF